MPRLSPSSRPATLALGLLGLASLAAALACANDPGAKRRPRNPDHVAVVASGLLIGEFGLSPGAVIDGDTIEVEGLESSLRLVGVDTEETFKHERERRAYALGWEQYLAAERGSSPRPVKMATPMGDAAKHFAERFFAGVSVVRLERDHPREVQDRFGRLLAYVLVKRDGSWVNYNVECVRAGMSPYFTKYGYSRRFHAELVAAQEEARAAALGIWSPSEQHYPDYDERLAWWDERARILQAFELEAVGHPERIVLTDEDALERLREHEGREVELLASVVELKRGRGPTRVMLSRRRGQDLPLVFFDPVVLAASRIEERVAELVRVRGKPSVYEYKGSGKRELQLIVSRPEQVVLP